MAVTPETVFRSLTDPLRVELLSKHEIEPTEDGLRDPFETAGGRKADALRHDLNCIATLGTEHAARLVHDFLTEEGWTVADFEASDSTRGRACALLCINRDAFDDALAIWNGNRLRGQLDREQGFRLPDVGGYVFEPPSEDALALLQSRIATAVSQSYRNKEVTRVRLFKRRSAGLPTESDTVIQCDVSMGDDPENIEIIDQGEETKITISRLSRISIIIDVEARTLFVGTQFGKKTMHQALAEVMVQTLFRDGNPPKRLTALRVYPERCREPVQFAYSADDGIEAPRVSELRYRLYGAPNALVFSVRDEEAGSQIHDHEDVKRRAGRMRIWRAVVDFVFQPPDGRPGIRRQVALTDPSGISFGGAFPEERVIIERVLTQSGLIDPNFDWARRSRFSDLARFITPQHKSETESSWLPLTMKALIDAGVVVQGQPHPRAWCGACGESHEIGRRLKDEGAELFVKCPVEQHILRTEQVDTLVLSPDGLVNWLMKNAVAGEGRAERIGEAHAQAWRLGRAIRSGKGKPYDLILALDVDRPETTRDLNEHLLVRRPEGPGVILTLVEEPVQKVFPIEWRTAPLSAVCAVKNDTLKFAAGKLAALGKGRKTAEPRLTDEDWDEIYTLFQATYDGETGLQPYSVANAMIAATPDVCRVTAPTLVNRLRKQFPDRFL